MTHATDAAEALAGRCLDAANLADAATAWVGDDANRDKAGAEAQFLRREFRRTAIRARKLATAAKRNMCVGVYGPSQAGKSYLISALGRPKGSDLMAAFHGVEEPLRYLDKINPEGQGESTGLVTRFTTAEVPAPPGFPVKVRFLSEPDVAKILANAFAMDGDGSESAQGPEDIERLLADAEAKATGDGDPAFPAEEMWEVQEYISAEFGRLAYFAPLRTYWDRAAAVVSRLDLAGRTELLSVLWGRHDSLTRLFSSLASHLGDLGDAREAFVPLAAIAPREESIIDVQTLKELDGEPAFDPVEVRAALGESRTIPRGYLTALVAEMVVPMAETPWDFMNDTDLLDFPGTRNRFTQDLAKYLIEGESPLSQLFLRGKVAYLFDRYVAEHEMTSMLLCVGDGNMEAKDLPGLVDRWVSATHGPTPEERAAARCILFFVLTKFDTLLVESGGAGDEPGTRFDRRVQNSMIEPFGKMPDSWLNDWAGGVPFKNTFWLRNPQYEATVIEYDANGREIGVWADRRDRVAALRAGAVHSELVRHHFRDPSSAWEAAMTIDDGGVTRLADALAQVCLPEVKLEQVAAQLNAQVRNLVHRLAPLHVSSDIETRLAQKRVAADRLIETLNDCFELNRWGEMMEALVVDPAQIADAIARIPADIYIVASEEIARAAPPADGAAGGRRPRPGRPRPGSGAAAPRTEAAQDPRAPREDLGSRMRRMTLEAFQAERSLALWMEGLHAFLDRPERLARYQLTEAVASDLVSELIEASRRIDLDVKIRTALERWNFSLHSERRAGPVATVAAETINAFVARLGMDALPEAERPAVEFEGGSRRIFEEEPVTYGILSLPEQSRQRSEERFVDWTFALYRTFEDNARNVDGAEVDLEQNLRLGEILARLAEHGPSPEGGIP